VRDVSDPGLEPGLHRIREGYRQKLPGMLSELAEQLRGARDERAPEQRLDASCRLVHKLKGTSGSFGFTEISAELARIEEQLEHLLSGAAPDRIASWAEIEQALDRARAAARSGS
jgi:HPt (histidine-containing phosphotransfer) domain-containing protein